MKTPQDNESRPDLTMSIYDVITIVEEVEELVWKAASGLKDGIEVQTRRKDWELLEFKVTKECIDLAEVFSKAEVCIRELTWPHLLIVLKVSEVHDKLEIKGEEILEREPGEKRIM